MMRLRWWSSFVMLFLALVPLLITPSAWAGSYTVSYSGGTWDLVPVVGSEEIGSYSLVSGGYGIIKGGIGGIQSLKESGPIKVTFTWQPSNIADTPPENVIVYQLSQAGASAPNGVAMADTGLGLGSAGQHISSTLYSVKNGAASFTITCSPSASAITPLGTYPGNSAASIVYKAMAYPVTINLTGTKPDSTGAPNILIGQGCTVSLDTTPFPVTSQSNWSWTVPGHTFQKWELGSPAPGASPTQIPNATLTDGPGPLNQSTAKWYWSDLAPVTEVVQCTATVATPVGTGGPLTVNASRAVTLLEPNAPEPEIDLGMVQINTNDDFQPGKRMLYVGPNGNNGIFGITWTENMTNPPPFDTDTGGKWNFLQITGFPQYDGVTSTGAVHHGDNYNTQGLDGGWPYSGQQYTFGTVPLQGGDAPGVEVQDMYVHYDIDQVFNTYVMYLPPGSDSQWVPLWLIAWDWTATPNIPGTSWSAWPTATSAGNVEATDAVPWIVHPTWNSLVTNLPF